MNGFMKNNERAELGRLLFNNQIDELVIMSLRTIRSGLDPSMPNEWVNLSDLIEFLTDAIDKTIDDNKQEALKGLRLLLRCLKRNEHIPVEA